MGLTYQPTLQTQGETNLLFNVKSQCLKKIQKSYIQFIICTYSTSWLSYILWFFQFRCFNCSIFPFLFSSVYSSAGKYSTSDCCYIPLISISISSMHYTKPSSGSELLTADSTSKFFRCSTNSLVPLHFSRFFVICVHVFLFHRYFFHTF